MALFKPHHTYNSLRLIMSSRFFIPSTHALFISPSPPSIFLKSRYNFNLLSWNYMYFVVLVTGVHAFVVIFVFRSNFGVKRLLTNRVLAPSVMVSPRSFMSSSSSSVTEVRKKKEGPENYGSENIQVMIWPSVFLSELIWGLCDKLLVK